MSEKATKVINAAFLGANFGIPFRVIFTQDSSLSVQILLQGPSENAEMYGPDTAMAMRDCAIAALTEKTGCYIECSQFPPGMIIEFSFAGKISDLESAKPGDVMLEAKKRFDSIRGRTERDDIGLE